MKFLKFISIVVVAYTLLFGDCVFIYLTNKPNPQHKFLIIKKYTYQTTCDSGFGAIVETEKHESVDIKVDREWYNKYKENQSYYGKFKQLEIRDEDTVLFTLSVICLFTTLAITICLFTTLAITIFLWIEYFLKKC